MLFFEMQKTDQQCFYKAANEEEEESDLCLFGVRQ